MITNSLEVMQLEEPDSKLIKTFAKTEVKAQQLNYAIVKSYQQLRLDGVRERRLDTLQEFKDKMGIQEGKVKDYKTRLDGLSKKLGISYKISASGNVVSDSSEFADELFKGGDMLLGIDDTRFVKVSEDYEREVAILKAIKSALKEYIDADNSPANEDYKIYESGWTEAIEKLMKARKVLETNDGGEE